MARPQIPFPYPPYPPEPPFPASRNALLWAVLTALGGVAISKGQTICTAARERGYKHGKKFF